MIKSIALSITVNIYTQIDFGLWNLFLMGPLIVSIYIGAIAKREGEELRNRIGKYWNTCSDIITIQLVRL